jgi:hypothetical protein
VVDGDGWILWRGTDLVLRRRVGILIVEAGHPHRDAVATAAVRAGGVRHPGSVHIYDVADTDDGGLQVVREWVDARTLIDRLAEGPLDDSEACRIGAGVGRILGEAHRTGVAHGRLTPGDVFVSDDGRVRVIGIAVSAALDNGLVEPDEERRAADARDSAAVSYAAVTGRWPGRFTRGLPAAPTTGGSPARARQVRAGVPAALDTALARLLETAIDADDAAEELEDLEGRLRDQGPGGLLGAQGPAEVPSIAPRHRALNRALAIAVCVAVLAATVVIATVLLRNNRQAPPAVAIPGSSSTSSSSTVSPSATSPTPSTSSGAPVGPLVIHGVKDFDPEGDGSEEPQKVDLAVDGDLSTAWPTLRYREADMAPKHGVGLVLDLGSAQAVGAVRIDLVGIGTDLQVRTSLTRGPQPGDYALVGHANHAGRLVTVKAKTPVQARYILIWLTRLPPGPGGFRGGIAEVTVLRA